jgi:hypothetical protein
VVSKGLGCDYRAVGCTLKDVNKANVACIVDSNGVYLAVLLRSPRPRKRGTLHGWRLLSPGSWILAPGSSPWLVRSRCRWG